MPTASNQPTRRIVRTGFLGLGKGESLVFSPESSRYRQVRDGVSLFRKIR